jgi:hypothetical protein
MAQSGAGSDGVNDRMLDLAKAFKDNKANARTLAELGFIGGDAISKEIASGFLEMNELTKNSTAARKSLDEEEFKAREEYIRSMRGYNAKLDEFYAASLNRVMDFTFAMTGNDASDFVKSMDNLVSGMTNMMTSDYAKAAATAFGEAFGEMAFQPFMRTFGLDPNEDRDVIDVLKVTGMIGGGMGAIPPQLAKLLQGPGNIRGMFRGAEAGLKSMFPQFIENKGTENETFNYDKFIEEATKVTADLTNDTITRLTTKLAPLIKN